MKLAKNIFTVFIVVGVFGVVVASFGGCSKKDADTGSVTLKFTK